MTNQSNSGKGLMSIACLSQDMMVHYMADKLKNAEKRQVEEHLVDCALCSDALEGLLKINNKNSITVAVNEINNKINQRTGDRKPFIPYWDFKWKAAMILVVVALLGTLGYVFRNGITVNEENPTDSSINNAVNSTTVQPNNEQSDKTTSDEVTEEKPSSVPASVNENYSKVKNETKNEPLTENKPSKKEKNITAKENSSPISAKEIASAEKTNSNAIAPKESNLSEQPTTSNSSTEKIEANKNNKPDNEFYLAYSNKLKENSENKGANLNANPEFPGGQEKLSDFIKKNLQYPLAAKEKNIHGTVKVGFLINADGTLSDIKVIKAVSKELDEEAIRLVKSMPKWNPAKYQGEDVEVSYSLGIQF